MTVGRLPERDAMKIEVSFQLNLLAKYGKVGLSTLKRCGVEMSRDGTA